MSSPHDTDPTTGTADANGTAASTAPGSGDGLSPHRRLVAVMLLVVALAAVGLVALGASADRGPGAVYLGATEGTYLWGPKREPYSEPDWSTYDVTTRPPDPDGPNTGVLIALVVLGTLLLALAIWVAHRMRQLARPTLELAGLADDEEELTASQATAALARARSSLATVGDPQDAVIAAWLALERALAEAGVRRLPSQTTLEFVVTVLGALELDRARLDRLSHLYRRALFDPAPLEESDRDQALELLDRLTDELDDGTGEEHEEGRR